MEFLRENKKVIVLFIVISFIIWTVSAMLIPLLFS